MQFDVYVFGDDTGARALLAAAIEPWTATGALRACAALTALDELQDSDPGVAFVALPDDDAAITAAVRKISCLLPGVAVVVAVDTDEEHRAARALSAGAIDFLALRAIDDATMRRVVARASVCLRNGEQNGGARAHEKLASSHAMLERWAAELEIANARLREVDDLKTKFLSEVSHEIRTPLAAVVSAAKIITKHHATRPEVVERFGQTILSEGERLTRLINEFLDLTKIEAGCMEWNDSEVNLRALSDDVTGGLSSLAMDKNIELLCEVSESLPPCIADHDRLIQVLANLVNNALKYTPEHGRIRLAIRNASDAVEFEVCDSGPGIPPEDLPKVFDRFHQVRNSQTVGSNQRGTGLGLCICREIVEHYGGQIWAESTIGEGSRFKFTIPAHGEARAAARKVSAAERGGGAHAARVLALLGDDELAERVQALPSDAGIDCRAVVDAEAALALLGHWRADVAVVAAPFIERHGDELLEQIQSQGVGHILVYSPQLGFAYVGALESSDAIVRSIGAIAPRAGRVAIVEDDDQYRSLLEFQLRDAGYEVLSADNGLVGLELIRAENPDLVLLDIIMPVMDGMSVLETMQNEGIDVPVAVLTAMDDSRVAVAARELGARAVFRKDSAEEVPYRTVIARIQRVFASALPVSGRGGAVLES
jgi:signal transduction histidine kinase/CheY-like chemotaxis protein